MKKGTGIIIITAAFTLLLCAGCAGQEDSAIEVTVTAPSGTAAPEEKVQPETAEEAPEAGESNQKPCPGGRRKRIVGKDIRLLERRRSALRCIYREQKRSAAI